MRDGNLDLRVIRTKESIREAFVKFIEEKGFEAITVKDISTKAKINRGTFYAHYQDKYDLMTKCQDALIQEMYRIVQQNMPHSIDHPDGTEVPFKNAIQVFEYINENSNFVRAILGPKGDLSFQFRLKQFISDSLYNDRTFIKEKDLQVPASYLISYISSAHVGLIEQWLSSGKKESPQEMGRILATITINGPLFAAGYRE
ncbi:TetR/AcrR family transcriptional regulator [Gracilibacillus caseinilyticus]|uniref:TetR/AcrR family transcriptional regulator n=1 Tax=Gracilibacillus caseinilyticus TaxID=2932256 RepID=A0ABY4EX50_9BACI|nr:TetR/AcrR family transcriptional regulator [Gracilibacillus caseinilyticus]UOQ49000.1 TetR/AcrR family transcriptional regulator [Gracilibacillus caseinilyticus]